MNGFLLLNKPVKKTSHDMVAWCRKVAGTRKVGHCGTLDPLAEGLLILAIGEATKFLSFLVGLPKTYVLSMKFGLESDTYDVDGDCRVVKNDVLISQNEIEEKMRKQFSGDFMQVPPKFSALRIAGKRAYELARSGEDFEMQARKVNLERFEILKFDFPDLKMRIDCGSGFYVRSLVHDLANRLGSAAVMTELKRERIGRFESSEACDFRLIKNAFDLREFILPVDLPLDHLMKIELSEGQYNNLALGRFVDLPGFGGFAFLRAYFKGEFGGLLEKIDTEKFKFKRKVNLN
jgi:tRNA pseudouridine55 synthase